LNSRLNIRLPIPNLQLHETPFSVSTKPAPGQGHTKLESTVRYLGIEVEDALELAEQTEV
jgi:hypothetical protein